MRVPVRRPGLGFLESAESNEGKRNETNFPLHRQNLSSKKITLTPPFIKFCCSVRVFWIKVPNKKIRKMIVYAGYEQSRDSKRG